MRRHSSWLCLVSERRRKAGKGLGCCACTPDAVARAQAEKRQGGIKVLGGGCAKCHELEENTKAALAALGLAEDVQRITDFSVIATYGVMVHARAGGG